MISSRQTETVAIKHCRNCYGQLPASAKFCRWCGVNQSEDPAATASEANWNEQKTKPVEDYAEMPQSLSSRTLDTMAQNVTAKTGSLRLSRFGVLVIAVLIAIPMWLLIILLSPLDAYMSAKAASSQMSIQ